MTKYRIPKLKSIRDEDSLTRADFYMTAPPSVTKVSDAITIYVRATLTLHIGFFSVQSPAVAPEVWQMMDQINCGLDSV